MKKKNGREFDIASGGVLPVQMLRGLCAQKGITADTPLRKEQFQPSSIDLRLGTKAYRIRSSFLPQRGTVEATLKELVMYELDLRGGAILERENVYLIPLLERLALPRGIRGRTNPKSSTGRLDIFTRVISDHTPRFEDIREGYEGGLYLEVVPRSFTIKVRTGLSLNQLRLFSGPAGASVVDDHQLRSIHNHKPLVYTAAGKIPDPEIRGGLTLGVETHTDAPHRVIGYKAKKNSAVIDTSRVGKYRIHDFWETIESPREKFLILEPEEFYIFASKERVRVPMDCAAEMVEFDAGSGELRTHYAGFFDSGFGDGGVRGTKAVLEVRPHDVPFRIEDGQLFFKLRYEKMAAMPSFGYGSGIGSSYHNQGLKLSKHFVVD
ncbi:MAG: 2'-deoxycytidine 5'-triphosphate deaminase [Nitrospinae bacterium]|nr:2'-deoxycytidine 5'-triphosphate deaminase [Nitrospinota bacterium]